MKWFALKKTEWPVSDMPSSYFTVMPDHPDLGALNAILASSVRAIRELEGRVESLERQVHDLMQWP